MRNITKSQILSVLKENNFNILRTANILGMSRTVVVRHCGNEISEYREAQKHILDIVNMLKTKSCSDVKIIKETLWNSHSQ